MSNPFPMNVSFSKQLGCPRGTYLEVEKIGMRGMMVDYAIKDRLLITEYGSELSKFRTSWQYENAAAMLGENAKNFAVGSFNLKHAISNEEKKSLEAIYRFTGNDAPDTDIQIGEEFENVSNCIKFVRYIKESPQEFKDACALPLDYLLIITHGDDEAHYILGQEGIEKIGELYVECYDRTDYVYKIAL